MRFIMDIYKELDALRLSNRLSKDISLLADLIDCIPYPIQVYAPDGTSVFVNRALLNDYNIDRPDKIVGKYNVFKDYGVTTAELLPFAKSVFNGETFFKTNIKVPLEAISLLFAPMDLDIEAMFLDMTIFPIIDKDGKIPYAAALFINRRIYRGKKEIERVKEYIEAHCIDNFDINEVAKVACLSKTHLTRLFKKHTGTTLHEYYLENKINKLKEKLLDLELSVTQAFNACGLNYNGHFAKVFKEKTGLSPSQYRKTYRTQ